MRNLYSMTKNADAIRRLFGVDASHNQHRQSPIHARHLPGLSGADRAQR